MVLSVRSAELGQSQQGEVMTLKSYTFYLEFGEENLTEEVELDEATLFREVQKIYEVWRDEHLVCGWWDKDGEHTAYRLLQGLRQEKEEVVNG